MKFRVRSAGIDDLNSLVEFVVAEANEAEGIVKSPDIVLNGIKAGLENPDIARYWIIEMKTKIQLEAFLLSKSGVIGTALFTGGFKACLYCRNIAAWG